MRAATRRTDAGRGLPWASQSRNVPLTLACFTRAFSGHDLCYRTCGSVRATCDHQFREQLQSICAERYPTHNPLGETCRNLAYIYEQVVVRLGELFFEASQVYGCACQASQPSTIVPGGLVLAVAPFEDTDDNLLPDAWELEVGLDPTDPTDNMADHDADGLNHLQEFLFGADPLVLDLLSHETPVRPGRAVLPAWADPADPRP